MEASHRKALVRAFYSERAASYDNEIKKHPILSSIREEIVRECSLIREGSILDLGCGSGLTAFAIRSKSPGVKIVGIDISDEMVRVAKKRAVLHGNSRLIFLVGDMERIPFKDSTFDLVVCINVIRYLDGLEDAFSDIHRVLKEKGGLILVDGDRNSREINDQVVREEILKKHPLEREFVRCDGWSMLFGQNEIEDGLAYTGFRKVRVESRRMYLIARAMKG
ncbi:MAG TPA: class I SAM-dependent methyltransferase [Candidatus Syntrophoarchaeum butanivorans]|uniref:Class I SAM-dependent methyltransferase n=1 Tax=Candidatus Syntropharchaeum butanivorans TaxID=1839936 RepID=A0A7C0X1U2_9EURY|nr:class I SAM-dependent methyltransferase [Candidatus Syntrophoarchaeum butanivorans]